MAARIGVISADDKRKLDGIEAGAQVNSTVVASQAVNGLMSKDDKKKLDAYSAVSSESGKFMSANGSWATPKDDDSWATEKLSIARGTDSIDVKRSSGAVEFTIPNATTLSAGVLTAADKIKLDGAAATGHKHAAGDITSGTLAVARGGTGQTTLALARNAMGLGNTTGALPVANGGTGATTAANALTNLGAAAASHTHNYAASNHTHATVTSSAAGFMSSADKTKLDGIAAGANAYSHPTTTAATGTPTVNASPAFGGTFTVNQVSRDTSGHVSAITSRTITIPSATATTVAAGLMSKDDKIKLNGIAAGAQVNSVTGVKGDSESAYRTGNVNITVNNIGAAASNHNHDSAYAAKSHSHSEYAAASHGNHVPTTQTASNKVFLRNDNSWQTVTPANIGAAASSHTHNYAGSSSAGGAATSATKLATARTISIGGGASGTASFDGSADAKISLGSINAASITSGTLAVARGGTGQTTLALARNAMGLGNTTGAVPVANGGTGATSASAALTNLGAAASGHTHSGYASSTHDHAATAISSGAVPIAHGGTGATDAASARANLGITTTSISVGTADQLKTSTHINGVSYNGTSSYVVFGGSCNTAADVAAKAVTISNFVNVNYAVICVMFNTINTASNPTLSVNSQTARAIYKNGARVTKEFTTRAGQEVLLIYHTMRWNIVV